MSPEFAEIITLIDRGGVLATLIVIIFGGMRGWFVWRREYEKLEKDRDWWRTVAMRSLRVADASMSQGGATERVDDHRPDLFRDER